MFSTKLLMNEYKPLGYVEDESLVFKRVNQPWGSPSTITISNLDTTNAFTFCGTFPPNITGYIFHVLNYRISLANQGGKVYWRNSQTGAGICNYGYYNPLHNQPYVAATMFFPEAKTQTLAISSEGGPVVTSTGSWGGTLTSTAFKLYTSYTGSFDLLLVYNRVLTQDELDQNYRTFAATYR